MSTLRSELSVLSAQPRIRKCPLGTDEGAENAALELSYRCGESRRWRKLTGPSEAACSWTTLVFIVLQQHGNNVARQRPIEQGSLSSGRASGGPRSLTKDLRAKISAQKATLQLWGLLEDEQRLSRENSVDRQIIQLDGQDIQVQVARLGLVAMYFYTEDGKAGFAKKEGTTWTWVVLNQSSQAEHVRRLIDQLTKGVRSGRFELPTAAFENEL